MIQYLPESFKRKFTEEGAPGRDALLLRKWPLRSRALVKDETVDERLVRLPRRTEESKPPWTEHPQKIDK